MFLNLKAIRKFWTYEIENILQLIITLQLLAFSISIFCASYYDYSLTESLSFPVRDSWCNSSTMLGIGNHCFGDFYYFFRISNLEDPWNSAFYHAYPPLALFIFKPYIYLNSIFSGTAFSIIVYLLTTIMFVGFALLRLIRNIDDKIIRRYIVVAVMFSGPILVAVDRGVNNLLVFGVFLLFARGIIEEDNRQLIIWGCFLVVLKPQFLILSLVWVKRNNLKNFFKIVLIWLATLFSSFILYPKNPIAGLLSWMEALRSYQSYGGTSLMPVNISLSNSLGIVVSIGRYLSSGTTELYSLSSNANSSISISIICFIGLLFWLSPRNSISLFLRFSITVILSIVLTGTSFHHYYLFLVGVFITAIAKRSENNQKSGKPSAFEKLLLIEMALIIPVWSIPLRIVLPYKFRLSTDSHWQAISLHWQVANLLLIVLLSLGISTAFRSAMLRDRNLLPD